MTADWCCCQRRHRRRRLKQAEIALDARAPTRDARTTIRVAITRPFALGWYRRSVRSGPNGSRIPDVALSVHNVLIMRQPVGTSRLVTHGPGQTPGRYALLRKTERLRCDQTRGGLTHRHMLRRTFIARTTWPNPSTRIRRKIGRSRAPYRQVHSCRYVFPRAKDSKFGQSHPRGGRFDPSRVQPIVIVEGR